MRAIRGAVVLFLGAITVATAQPLSHRTADEENTIAVFKKAKRGVLHINVSRSQTEPFGTYSTDEGIGSGFLIDSSGHILTNYHVVSNSNRLEVHLPQGRIAISRIVGTAPTLDVALLKIELESEDLVEPLTLGDSSALEVGQKVVAIGHPLALHNTLTVGVLSAEGRTLPEGPVELRGALLQTDAAINPGSSGGPLLDSSGQVIGIATAVAATAQNVGFAVPINLVKRVVPDLIEMGHPYRPSLGIDGVGITPELAELFDLPAETAFLWSKLRREAWRKDKDCARVVAWYY